MRSVFENYTPVHIGAGEPNIAISQIGVTGMAGVISNVRVAVAIDHTYTSDLVVVLVAPDGQQRVLAMNVGGGGDDMLATFSDAAPFAIEVGQPPFAATYRPAEPLSDLGGDPNGVWQLVVIDQEWGDGGQLAAWAIEITTVESADGGHPIEVVFRGGLNAAQRAAFEQAADVWSSILRASVPPVDLGGDIIRGVRIEAAGIQIDGPAAILGRATYIALRPGSLVPATGIMEFDTADLANMEMQGNLVDVIVHEMGHVLGIGTLWKLKLLVAGSGTMNPTFLGAAAMQECAALTGAAAPAPVPIANTGGPGTREGHWRESLFGHELMTGWVGIGANPLSRLTIASLADLGYAVDIDAADPYALPTSLELAIIGIGSDPTFEQCCTLGHGPEIGPVILPPESLV